MKKIVILGCGGLLGGEFVEQWSKKEDIDLISLNRNQCDLLKEDDLQEVFKHHKPDIIINCAAYTNVEQAEEDTEIAMAVNAEAVATLVELCKQNDCTLVHFSTDYVFDGTNKEPYREDNAVSPINAYGKSKADGEKAIQVSGAQAYIIRTSWPFGKHGQNFVEKILHRAKKIKNFNIICDQIGCPSYTKDTVEATYKLIKDEYQYGIYHFCSSGETSWADFAREFFTITGTEVQVTDCLSKDYPQKAKRPKNSALENTKFPTLRNWKDALKEYLSERNT